MLTILLIIAAIAVILWFLGGWGGRFYGYGSPVGWGPLIAVLVILFLIWLFTGGL